jgi:hypothetical protein
LGFRQGVDSADVNPDICAEREQTKVKASAAANQMPLTSSTAGDDAFALGNDMKQVALMAIGLPGQVTAG